MTFEWKQVNAVDDPTGMHKAYEGKTRGWLWMPEENIYRQPFNVPRILVLPTVGFNIFHSLGSKVMQHELHAATKLLQPWPPPPPPSETFQSKSDHENIPSNSHSPILQYYGGRFSLFSPVLEQRSSYSAGSFTVKCQSPSTS
jgi:hypothetical protein